MDGEVIETPSGDYRFRAFIPRNHLVTVLMNLGERMAYPNFKDSIPEDDIARCKRLSPGMGSVRRLTGGRAIRCGTVIALP